MAKEINKLPKKRPLKVLESKGRGGIYLEMNISDKAADEIMLQNLEFYRAIYISPFFDDKQSKKMLTAIETILRAFGRLDEEKFFKRARKIARKLDKDRK
jgi:hypothetical protein